MIRKIKDFLRKIFRKKNKPYYGPSVFLPIIRRCYPTTIANELIEVHPLREPKYKSRKKFWNKMVIRGGDIYDFLGYYQEDYTLVIVDGETVVFADTLTPFTTVQDKNIIEKCPYDKMSEVKMKLWKRMVEVHNAQFFKEKKEEYDTEE